MLQHVLARHPQETCVSATWMKLCHQLLRLTGETRYAEEFERTLYNALLGAQRPDGAEWVKYLPLAGIRQRGENQCGMELNCCIASAPRGLLLVPSASVMRASDGLSVLLYAPGSFVLRTPGGQSATVRLETEYPLDGRVRVTLDLPQPELFTLRLRVPVWSRRTSFAVDGIAVSPPLSDGYAVLRREWSAGDVLDLELEMKGRIEYSGTMPRHAAILRGPLLLARDARLGGPAVDEAARPVVANDGSVELSRLPTPLAGTWVNYRARFVVGSLLEKPWGDPVELTLCDFASAGNTWDERSRYRVWLPQLLDLDPK
jgi:DUF1680 family protein